MFNNHACTTCIQENKMSIKKAIAGRRNTMRDDWMLTPFHISQMYNVDEPGPYEPLVYGKQYQEFYSKFVLNPLQNDKDRQVIGALWSTYAANRLGKGYGKSMLMAEESKRINADFGVTKLREFGVDEEDVIGNPFVAGYCTFKESMDVKSFPAALLEAVGFILASNHGESRTVHQELRRRICERIEAEDGYEGDSIRVALHRAIRQYRSLGVQLTHRETKGFIEHLCADDTPELINRMMEIGPRIKAAQGFNFVHIFNVFLRLSGIEYVVYFIDQIENFAKYARKQDQNIRILRESICETSPTREMASFVFQMHVEAQHVIEDWWDKIEHLPSLDAKKRINSSRIVELQGLASKKEAVLLLRKHLADNRVPGSTPPSPLHPLNEDIVEQVRHSQQGNPREFLRQIEAILKQADNEGRVKLDLAFVQPFLEDIPEAIGADEDEDEYSNVER
jgi:hypothetical protein